MRRFERIRDRFTERNGQGMKPSRRKRCQPRVRYTFQQQRPTHLLLCIWIISILVVVSTIRVSTQIAVEAATGKAKTYLVGMKLNISKSLAAAQQAIQVELDVVHSSHQDRLATTGSTRAQQPTMATPLLRRTVTLPPLFNNLEE
jgi:hypothetical protein